jgi:hypothetical protein
MYIGNGRLDAREVKGPFTLGDANLPCLALQWAPQPVRGDKQTVQRYRATVAIDADGAGTAPTITLAIKRRNFIGTDLADLTYVISGAAAKSDWSDVSASDTASAAVLKDLIDLINEIEGFKAWALHAPHNMSLNSTNFIDLAATDIAAGSGPEDYSQVVYRDVSGFAINTNEQVLWARIGLPEARDKNAFWLDLLQGEQTGATSGVVRLYRDDYLEYGEDPEVYVNKTAVATTLTDYVDYTVEDAPLLRGPCILEVTGSDLTAATFRAHIRQASLGA